MGKGQKQHPHRKIERKTMKRISLLTAGCLLAACIFLTGCPSLNSTATLVTVLGNAASSIATIEGNTQLAATLKTDTAAASSAVLNWKKGMPSQNVIQALNLVEADLNLIPGTSTYAPLVDLAIGTVESIIEIVQPGATSITPQNKRVGVTHRVWLANPPKTDAQFRTAWNGIIAQHPELSAAKQ
jgi:hypothetical protein